VALEKIYDEPFETVLAREIEKAAAHGQRHAAAIQTTGEGYTGSNEPLPAVLGAHDHTLGDCGTAPTALLRYAAWQTRRTRTRR
jgi:hypothetical protein